MPGTQITSGQTDIHHLTSNVIGAISTLTVIGSFASLLSTALSIILTGILIFWYCVHLWKDKASVKGFLNSWRKKEPGEPQDPQD